MKHIKELTVFFTLKLLSSNSTKVEVVGQDGQVFLISGLGA